MKPKRKRALKITVLCLVVLLVVLLAPLLKPIILYSVGHYEGIKRGTPFEEAHTKAINSFVEEKGFGVSRFRRADLWNEWSVIYDQKEYEVFHIRLIGLSSEYGERLFHQSRPPKKTDLAAASSRPLTPEESLKLSAFSGGSIESIELPPDLTFQDGIWSETPRVAAPIFASEDCMRCHEGEVGTVLGAFEYFLIPF